MTAQTSLCQLPENRILYRKWKKIRIVFSAILRWIESCDPINQYNCPKFNLERLSQDRIDGKCRKHAIRRGLKKPKYAQEEPQCANFRS